MRISDWSSDVCSSDLADDFNIVSIEEAILQACINVLRDGHTNASQSLPGKYGIRVIDDVFRILTHARDTSATADKSLQAVIRAEVQQTIQHKAESAVVALGACARSEEHTSELQSLLR